MGNEEAREREKRTIFLDFLNFFSFLKLLPCTYFGGVAGTPAGFLTVSL